MTTVTTGGEEMDVTLIPPAINSAFTSSGSEELVVSDWFRRELKIPTVRSAKFCSILAVEEADWVVTTRAWIKPGGSGFPHVNATSLGEPK